MKTTHAQDPASFPLLMTRARLSAATRLAALPLAPLLLAVVACTGGGPGAPPDASGQSAFEPLSRRAVQAAPTDVAGRQGAPDAAPGNGGQEMEHAAMGHVAADDGAAPGGADAVASGAAMGLAVRFAPELFGANAGDYGVAFAPDGETVFFTRAMPSARNEAIFVSRRVAGQWGVPEVAPFSGRFHDKEPYVSSDGARVYFASRRPLQGAAEKADFDIWYAERRGSGWSEPVRVEAVSSPFDDDYPAVAADGTLLFGRSNEAGDVDLWIAHAAAGGLAEPRPFPRPINSVYADADPWIAADGRTIVFVSPRITEGSQGQGDLYVIERLDDGWTAPRSLGLQVNSIAHEYGPALSPDGATFHFSRGFGGHVWSVPLSALEGLGVAHTP